MSMPARSHDEQLARGNRPDIPYDPSDASDRFRQSDMPQGVQESTYLLVEYIPNEVVAARNDIVDRLSELERKLDLLVAKAGIGGGD